MTTTSTSASAASPARRAARSRRPTPAGDGCDKSLAWWFTEEPWAPPRPARKKPVKPRDVMTMTEPAGGLPRGARTRPTRNPKPRSRLAVAGYAARRRQNRRRSRRNQATIDGVGAQPIFRRHAGADPDDRRIPLPNRYRAEMPPVQAAFVRWSDASSCIAPC